MNISHDYFHGTQHIFEITSTNNRVVNEEEDGIETEGYEHELDGFTYAQQSTPERKEAYRKWKESRITVQYSEEYVICPICHDEVVTSRKKIINN